MSKNRTMEVKNAAVRKAIGEASRNKNMDIMCQEYRYGIVPSHVKYFDSLYGITAHIKRR